VTLGVERHGQPIAFQQIFNEFPKLRTGNLHVVAAEMGGPIKGVHHNSNYCIDNQGSFL
jgi:hypothetical protein